MKFTCENCEHNGIHRGVCSRCVITLGSLYPSEWKEASETQLIIREIEKRPCGLKGNITSGYTYDSKYNEMYKKGSLLGMNIKEQIKDVIFNDPATIILWKDGTKTVIKCGDGDVYEPEKGLAMAICKKVLGTGNTHGNYYEFFKKWIPEEKFGGIDEDYVGYFTVKEVAARFGVSEKVVRNDIKKGCYPGAKKIKGKWMIPYVN